MLTENIEQKNININEEENDETDKDSKQDVNNEQAAGSEPASISEPAKNKKPDLILKSLQILATLVFVKLVLDMHIVPGKYVIFIIILLSMLFALPFFLQKSEKYFIAGRICSVITTVLLIAGIACVFKINKMISEISFVAVDQEVGSEIKEVPFSESLQTEVKSEEKNISDKRILFPKDSFLVYISGIDSYDLSLKSGRSDVNIIAAVNTKTRRILLTSTPRDYYVKLQIAGGQMDKLTHAGIYGVEESIQTLEKLYDISIDYYVRVNFKMLVDLVDAMGGITVKSEYAFDSYGFSFIKGENQLSGDEALVFVRERYALAEGDNQRIENQMLVIKALIVKATSAAILINAGEIIKTVSKNLETNMTPDEIASLIKMQMSERPSWEIEMNRVKGKGDMRTTYSGGNQELYVMIPNQDSVNEAKEKITDVIEESDDVIKKKKHHVLK
ncbi:MAG: LytR family transcriptional regulator [Sedimentibacter sp.]|jgi:LCP family protein required for cell wall assembly|nr:LytR family transcriptional regulator [Sedimentibacter sp.]